MAWLQNRPTDSLDELTRQIQQRAYLDHPKDEAHKRKQRAAHALQSGGLGCAHARARRRGDGGGRGGTFDDLVRREHGKLAPEQRRTGRSSSRPIRTSS